MVRMISSNPTLQMIPLDMRQHLAEDSEVQTYPKGSSIHQAGERLNHVDLIVAGEAQFQFQHQGENEHLKALKPGALVGESAVIHDTGCPADMITKTGVTIVHIAYTAFINVLEAYPPLRKSLMADAEIQRVQLMQKLDELQTQELK